MLRGPFSALRPFAVKYPVRSFALLFGCILAFLLFVHGDDLALGDLIIMALFFTSGMYVFIRYITRYITRG